MHDPRVKTGVGFQYALSDYGADYIKAPHDPFFKDKDFYGIEETKRLSILEPVSPTDLGQKRLICLRY